MVQPTYKIQSDMKTKEQIVEWLREKGIINKLMRNMHYYYPNKTFDKLINSTPQYILLYAFCWQQCNKHFDEDIDWCRLDNEYTKWY